MADFTEIICPFCKEADFDLIGLERHLENHWCEVFGTLDRPKKEDIPTLAEMRELLTPNGEVQGHEPTIQQLRTANIALVQALDRLHDVLSGDEYMENADVGIHEIINDAIRLHNLTPNVEVSRNQQRPQNDE